MGRQSSKKSRSLYFVVVIATTRPSPRVIRGEYVPAYFPTETLIVGAFQQQGEGQRGIATLQSSIAQYIFVLRSGFAELFTIFIS